jgi:hypothetical protein
MAIQYRWPHAVATVIACAAVGYQTAVIWESVTGVSNTVKFGIPLATVAAAILPVLGEAAWRTGERFKGAMFFLPVICLLVYVLPNGVSRLGEAQQARVDAATVGQSDQAKVRADLATANRLVSEAQGWVASECASGKGKRCEGQTFTLNQRQAFQRELQAKVDGFKPVTEPWLPSWHPATLPIGLELAAWVSLFFGLGPLTHAKKQVAAVQAITEREEPLTDAEIAELVRVLLKNGGKGVNNNTLAELIGCSAGESSKRVADAVACGLVTKVRNGREVLIRPAEGVTVH